MEIVFKYLDELVEEQEIVTSPRTRIGFKPDIL